jgi:hypothetical protein
MPRINKDADFAENRGIPAVCSYDTLFIELTDLRLTLTSPVLSTGDKTTVKITITRN